MRPRWRLLADGALPGATNMARDVAALEAVAAGAAPPTVRLYAWDPPCLSLGRHQPVAAADLAFCGREGIHVVRRPTGGRAVLHHLELTYAVVAPLGETLPAGAQAAYRLISAGLVRALGVLGVGAELTPEAASRALPHPTSAVPCFRAPAGGEVVVRGRKVVGSAMRVHRGVILQHGAILLGWDGRLQAGAVGLPDDGTLRPFVTTLADELGAPPEPAAVAAAVAEGLERELGVRLEPGGWRAEELERAAALEGRFAVDGEGAEGAA